MIAKITTMLCIAVFAVLCFGQVSITGPGGIVVQMDTTRGRIALGDTAGNKLMYNFNYPWTMTGNWLLFTADDDGFSNSADVAYTYGYTYLMDYSAGSGLLSGSVSKEWNVPYGTGELFFRLTVTPMELDGAGVAKIALYAFNGDNIPHNIGAMMFMDTYIGTNDRAPLATGTSLLSNCTVLSGDGVPYFWQAYEESPSAGCDQVIARGFLRGLGATPPDIFILADNWYLWRQPWDVDTSFAGEDYNDSAILIRWAKQPINPDKSITFVTYYGFGRCVADSAAVLLIPLVPGQLTPRCIDIESPFETAALVHNQAISAGVVAGTLCIEIPVGTELVLDPLHPDVPCIALSVDTLFQDSSTVGAWLVGVETTELWGDTIPIIINLSAEPDISISETSWVAIPSPDGVVPLVDVHFPYRYISCSDSGTIQIPFYLHDDTAIDITSVSVKLGDELFSMMSPYMHYDGDTLGVEIPSWMLVQGDTIEYQFLSVADIYGCVPDSFPPPGTLIVDIEPPEFGGFYPPADSTVTSVPQIRLYITDEPSGVDHSSVYLQFDGAVVEPDDPRLSWESDTVLIFTSSDTFPDGYPIVICLTEVSDNAEFCGPNVLSTLECQTYFVSAIYGKAIPSPYVHLWATPNPFNQICEIRLMSPTAASAKVKICDISGHTVAEIYDGMLKTGANRFLWKAEHTQSGIYFIVADVGKYRITRRVALIK